jgi:hypothetical protein
MKKKRGRRRVDQYDTAGGIGSNRRESTGPASEGSSFISEGGNPLGSAAGSPGTATVAQASNNPAASTPNKNPTKRNVIGTSLDAAPITARYF